MGKKLAVIYVPGLGDANPTSQSRAVGTWRWWGAEAELFALMWDDEVKWEAKFNKLLKRIDELAAQGKAVGLVGASAGASAVINAYAARTGKVVGVVLLAGKVNHPEAIGERYRKRNPSFVESAYQAPASLKNLSPDDRKHILSRYALFDGVVAKRDSRVAGARNRVSPTIGHAITIGLQLIFGAPSFISFLKRQIN